MSRVSHGIRKDNPSFTWATIDTVVVTALGLGYLALAIWLVTPPPPVGFYWDDGWYLMMAEWYSGRAEHRELVWSMLHLRQYPPFYPALLAAAGATLDRPEVGFLLNALAAAGAGAALLLWLRRAERFPMVAAAPASLALVLGPMSVAWLPTLFSEHVFILFTVLVLWLARIARSPRDWVILGVVAGMAFLTRNPGLALVVAVALSALLTRWRMLPWLALGLLPIVLGGWWLASGLPPAPHYRRAFSELLANLPTTEYLSAQFAGLAQGWQDMWGSGAGGFIALVAVLPGLWMRLRRNRADAWLVPITLLMLVLWPFPGHMSRYLWPLMPALLVCAAETTQGIKRESLRIAALAIIPVVVILGLPDGAVRTLDRVMNGPEPPLEALSRMQEWTRPEDRTAALESLQARRQLLLDMAQVQHLTPKQSCVYSELPALLAVQAKRVSPISPWQQLSELGEHQLVCDYYYLMPLGLPGSDLEAIRETAARHEVIYRSESPFDPTGRESMGVLFKLDRGDRG